MWLKAYNTGTCSLTVKRKCIQGCMLVCILHLESLTSLWCSVKFTSVLLCFNKISVLPQSTNMRGSALWTLEWGLSKPQQDRAKVLAPSLQPCQLCTYYKNTCPCCYYHTHSGCKVRLLFCVKFYIIYSKLSAKNLNNLSVCISVFDGVHALTGSN